MVNLADEQLRYATTAKLLQKTYAGPAREPAEQVSECRAHFRSFRRAPRPPGRPMFGTLADLLERAVGAAFPDGRDRDERRQRRDHAYRRRRPVSPSHGGNAGGDGAGVQVTGVTEDATDGPLVYDPSHPDANADGYVRYPNVSVTDEMVGLMDARRMYEANATVFQATKSMLKAAIDI